MANSDDRVRTVLLLDFDNIFGLMLTLDRAVAVRIAEDPGVLLDGLTREDPRRTVLVRRAYLNPAGWVSDAELGNDNNRLYFQRFRPNLVRAGFTVVDCPALTHAQKNAADIRMVLDTIDLIDHPTRFDEFVIASGDADFTPVLQRLRAHDRVTTVLTAGPVAQAYSAVADRLVDDSDLIAMVAPGPDEDDLSSQVTVDGSEIAEAQSIVRRSLDESAEPVNMSDLGNELHRELGTELIRSTDWLGFENLGSLVAATSAGFRCARGLAWDETRHDAPVSKGEQAMPSFVTSLCQVADLPRFRSEQWPLLFRTLADYASSHEFSLTESTSWSRDRMADLGSPVGRQPIGFVVRGAMSGGTALDTDPPPTADQIRDAFRSAMLDRAEAAGLDVDDGYRRTLHVWMSGGDPSDWAPPPADRSG